MKHLKQERIILILFDDLRGYLLFLTLKYKTMQRNIYKAAISCLVFFILMPEVACGSGAKYLYGAVQLPNQKKNPKSWIIRKIEPSSISVEDVASFVTHQNRFLARLSKDEKRLAVLIQEGSYSNPSIQETESRSLNPNNSERVNPIFDPKGSSIIEIVELSESLNIIRDTLHLEDGNKVQDFHWLDRSTIVLLLTDVRRGRSQSQRSGMLSQPIKIRSSVYL